MFRKNGFTLTEVLIVVAILGILASLAIPRLFPQTERARSAEAISMLSAIRQGEEAYRLEKGNYLALTAAAGQPWNQVGMDDPNAVGVAGFFSYLVNTNNAANPPQFTARATRLNVNPGGAQYSIAGSNLIGLSQNGFYCGDHPFTPTNAGCPQ